MKKLLALLICLILSLCPVACAETPESTPDASLTLTLPDRTLTLEYDMDETYSYYDGAYVQPSFFVYDQNADGSETLYEVYLTFPDTVLAGSTVSPETCIQPGSEDSSILLFVTDDTQNVYSVASQANGVPYPAESDYTIHFTEVSVSGTVYTYIGAFEATMVALDENYDFISVYGDISGSFRFSMDLGKVTTPSPYIDEGEAEPQTTAPPAPTKLVTPPDAKRI